MTTGEGLHIWITEIGEPLPIEGDVRLLRYGGLCRSLARAGHDVTWWASTFSHSRKAFLGDGDSDHLLDGVRLRLLAGPGYGRNISLARFRHQAHFARRFAEAAPRAPRPDVILTPIPTLETAAAAVRFGQGAGVPVIVDIRDEWPDEFVRLVPAPLRGGARLVLAPWYRMGRYACAHAARVWGISRRQLNYGLQLAGRPERAGDAVMPLGYSPTRYDDDKLADAARWWDAHGLRRDAFVVCFFGTIGKFFDLDTVIAAARQLEREFPVQFVLCGDGSQRQRFADAAAGCSAVWFPGWVDGPRIAALMDAASAGLAPYRAGADVFSLPNKPFEYLAGGLPVVSSIEGELRDLLAQHRCGVSYRGDRPDELAACIRTLRADPEARQAMGRRGRLAIEQEYSTTLIHARMEAALRETAASHSVR